MAEDGAKKRKRISRATLRYVIRDILWPRRGILLLGLLVITVNRAAGLVLPGSSKYLLDDVVARGQTSLLWTLVPVVGAAVIVQAGSSFLLTLLLSVEAQRLIAMLRARVQAHVLALPVSYFDRSRSGELVSRIMNDVEGVRNLIGTGLVLLVGGILTAAGAFVLLLRIDVGMTLVALVPLVVFGVLSLKAFQFIRPIFRERSRILADVTGRLTESLGGIRVIKGFDAEEGERRVFGDGVMRIFSNVKRSMVASSLVWSSSTLLIGLVTLLIMSFGATKIVRGTLTSGELLAFTLYLGFLLMPIVDMGRIGSQLTEAFAGLDRMEDLLAVARETDDGQRTVRLGEIRGEVEFDDVSFSYDEGREVLHGVSLVAAPGTVTALVGSSGSGKTTVASLAASFLTPDRGAVRVDGTDLAAVVLETYRSRLGVVLQDDFLFDGTIRENILFSRPDANEEDLLDAVRSAHVGAFTDGMEKGLDTLIGERGIKLSGGQRQRVSIARAILADPRVLILDEATSSLDTESEALIQESLARLMRGRTTFVIAHRLSTIRKADQILVMEDGRVVERGTHEALLAAGGRYHELYTYQARI